MSSELEKLLQKYYSGTTSQEEEVKLRTLLNERYDKGEMNLHKIQVNYFEERSTNTLEKEIKIEDFMGMQLTSKSLLPRAAIMASAAVSLLFIGFITGYLFYQSGSRVRQMENKISQLETHLIMFQLQQSSPTARINAVRATQYNDAIPDRINILLNQLVLENNPNVKEEIVSALISLDKTSIAFSSLEKLIESEKNPMVILSILDLMRLIDPEMAMQVGEQKIKQLDMPSTEREIFRQMFLNTSTL